MIFGVGNEPKKCSHSLSEKTEGFMFFGIKHEKYELDYKLNFFCQYCQYYTGIMKSPGIYRIEYVLRI